MVNVFLGSIQPFANVQANPNDDVDFSTTRYLGITVDADDNPATADPEMVPRQMIIPAFFAKNSQNLAGYNWSHILTGGSNNPQTGFLNGGKIQSGSITNVQIGAGQVLTANLGDGQITGPKLAAGAADGAISDESITSAKIKDGEVMTSDLAQNSVTSEKVVNGSLAGIDIGIESLTPAHLLRDIAIFSQKEAINVGGGSHPNDGSLVPRPLNTTDAQHLATGSSIERIGNTIQLQPGVYSVRADSTVWRASTFFLALIDVTGNPPIPNIVLQGPSGYNHYSNPPYAESSVHSVVEGLLSVEGGVRQYRLADCISSGHGNLAGSYSMGYPMGGRSNVFARITIERIK
jgi:hypothetical protein